MMSVCAVTTAAAVWRSLIRDCMTATIPWYQPETACRVPEWISGARNITYITEDIHFARGMDCIDCHTSRDIMGDGYAYENMYHQTEIGCEDCHGTGKKRPDFKEITRENDEAVRESKSYPIKMQPGMKMIITGKGRKYSNVFYESGNVYVLGKRTGKLHQSPVITGTPEHTIAGHERLECYTCHSRAVPQCFGCHTRYDRSSIGKRLYQRPGNKRQIQRNRGLAKALSVSTGP